MNVDWDWGYAFSTLPRLVQALGVTVQATVLGMALALVLGLMLSVLRRSRFRVISWPASFLIEFIRSTPLLVQLYFLFYVMPELGFSLSPLLTGILALGIHYAAYTSEVYRAGLEAVDRGQWEAARALGLGPVRTYVGVIFPQAIPPVIPALGNYLVAMFKDTPLLSTITVLELLYVARDISSETFRYTEPLTIVGVLFLIVSLIAAALVRVTERWLALPKRLIEVKP